MLRRIAELCIKTVWFVTILILAHFMFVGMFFVFWRLIGGTVSIS